MNYVPILVPMHTRYVEAILVGVRCIPVYR